jgi:EAL and modified HD-GYP domain-containing signal transduction protein
MQNTFQIFANECPAEIVQVGRQPILDRNHKIYGYELLYRHEDQGPGPYQDGNLATARTVLNTFLEFGMKHLVGDHRVFINLTRTFFTDVQPLPLDKKRLVLEVLEEIEPDPEVIAGIQALHAYGYVIALDDYNFSPHWDIILPYCSIIKIDVLDIDLVAQADKIATLKKRGLTLLAEKVETHQQHCLTVDLGFDLFQGYFFAKPQILSTNRLQSNEILLLKLVARINDPRCDINELATLVSQDPKLSFKILRFINSAAIGLNRQISSIKDAVIFIGLNRLRIWATLFVMAGMHLKTREIITTGLVRAQLCHSLTEELHSGIPDSGYSVGLLSILDAILNQPMRELVKDLPFPTDMKDALVYRSGPYGANLNLAMALEQGHVTDPIAHLLPLSRVNSMYLEAMMKTEEIRRQLS